MQADFHPKAIKFGDEIAELFIKRAEEFDKDDPVLACCTLLDYVKEKLVEFELAKHPDRVRFDD
jgi:hypothetical protein